MAASNLNILKHRHRMDGPMDVQQSLILRTCKLYLENVFNLHQENVLVTMSWTPLHSAIVSGDLERVRNILDSFEDHRVASFVLNCPLGPLHKEGKDSDIVCLPPMLSYVKQIRHLLKGDDLDLLEEFLYPGLMLDEGLRVSICEESFSFELPAALACCCEKVAIIMYLLGRGLSLGTTDSMGNNVVHDLVKIAERWHEKAVRMFELIFNELDLSVKEKRLLLETKNCSELRPVDIALTRAVPEMYKLILNTEGVYKELVTEFGLFQMFKYDISYRPGHSGFMGSDTIVNTLLSMSSSCIMRAHKCELLLAEPLKTVIDSLCISRHPAVSISVVHWAVTMFIYLALISVYVQQGLIHTGLNVLLLLNVAIFLCLEAFCTWKSKLCGFCNPRTLCQRWKAFSLDGVTSAPVYRSLQIIFCLTCAVFPALEGGLNTAESIVNWTHGEYGIVFFKASLCVLVLSTFMGFMSCLFYLHLWERTAHILVTLQRIIIGTAILFLLSLFGFFAFASAFALLSLPESSPPRQPKQCGKTMSNSNSTAGVETAGRLFFNTFLMWLQVVSPTKEDIFKDISGGWLNASIFLFFIIGMCIIINNFIISSLGMIIENVQSMDKTLILLERLYVIHTTALRMRPITKLIALLRYKITKERPENTVERDIVYAKDGRAYVYVTKCTVDDNV